MTSTENDIEQQTAIAAEDGGGEGGSMINNKTETATGCTGKKMIILASVLVAIGCIIGLPIAFAGNNEEETSSNNSTVFVSSTKNTLEFFNANITQGYDSKEELGLDIDSAGSFLLNQVIKRNLQVPGYEGVGVGRANPHVNVDGTGGTIETTTDESSNSMRGGTSDVTDYGTNNQEGGVEEGDLVASDGTLVYTAYGDYIVGFNARTGEQVFELRLPFNKTSSNYYGGGGMADIRMMIPQPAVRSLILHEASKRLVVISDGFASQKIAEIVANSDGSSNNKETTFPILFERYDTHIRLYDTDSLVAGNSDPLTTYDINGNFNAVRSIDGIVHIMTTTGIDVNSDLIVPFERSNKEFANMTDDEYIAAVQVKAKTAIPAFTNKLLDEITLPNGNVPNLARISIFSDQSNSGGMEELTMPLGPVNTYAQITTFDVSNSDQGVDATASGTFLSDYWARFYGATNSIIIASQGTKILEVLTRDNGKERRTSIDTTYFTAFSIDGTTTAPHSVGQVDGYLLNEHAIDVKDDALRVAVILWNYTYVWDPSWAMYDDAVMILEGDVVRNLQSDATSSPAVEMDDWLTTQPETVTQNFVVVLQMPGLDNNDKPGAMEEVGRVQIGKPGESITAVRFFDNIAYAVTFEQTDPFYVLDLENGAKVLGEVEISGFSSYLHSINDDNTLILAIGQETDSDGMILGLQLTVFDMSDPASPAVLQRHVVESSSNVDSYSDALWDFKAIRYAGGRLILPMDIYPIYENVTDTESFHGFVTFAVNATGITEECSINHVQEMSTTVCYYCSSLPRRSMIFDGNVVTMQNHGAMSTNMDTCQDQWQLALSVPSGDDCCNAWY